jgi:hypothetical protein
VWAAKRHRKDEGVNGLLHRMGFTIAKAEHRVKKVD